MIKNSIVSNTIITIVSSIASSVVANFIYDSIKYLFNK